MQFTVLLAEACDLFKSKRKKKLRKKMNGKMVKTHLF